MDSVITSTTNAQVKNLIKLRDRAKARKEQGVFLVEGEKMFLETPPSLLCQVYVSESYYSTRQSVLRRMEYDTEVRILSDSVFREVSDTMTPQGVLCVVRKLQNSLDELPLEQNPCFLLLEDIQDPGNLGTIVRTAEGAGITAVIMSRGTVDIYNPKVIRSTMGSIYRVPFLYTEDLKAFVSELREQQIPVYAAHLKDSVAYDKISYKGPCGILIGNEGNGLSDEISLAASRCIKIPMQGEVESLNAAVAASILMYEVYRQRR